MENFCVSYSQGIIGRAVTNVESRIVGMSHFFHMIFEIDTQLSVGGSQVVDVLQTLIKQPVSLN